MKTHTTRFYSIGQKVCFKKGVLPPHGLPNGGTVYTVFALNPLMRYVRDGAVSTQAVFLDRFPGVAVSGEWLVPEEEYNR